MSRSGQACVVSLAAWLGLIAGTPAWAQNTPAPAPAPPARPLFAPRVDIGVAYDDNLFSRPDATVDRILRISPSIEIRRETPKHTFSTVYSFDAERYREFTELTSPFVRQNASADWTARPTTRTTVGLRGGYWRTQTPSDLNLTTGLVTARQLATQWNAGTEITQLITPLVSFVVGYQLSNSDLADVGAVDTVSQTANVRVSRRLSPRSDVRAAYVGERWSFSPRGTELSQLGTLGGTRQLTDATSLSVDAGPRYAAGLLRPEVTVSLARRVGDRVDMSLAYAHTQSIAIGISGLIEVDSVRAGVTLRRPQVWELRLTGGWFRNLVGDTRVRAFDAAMEVSRALGAGLWFVANGTATFNTRADDGPVPSAEQQIYRNVVVISLRVDPWSAR
jgi:hypothetical protein